MQEHEYIHTHFSNKRTFTLPLGTFLMLDKMAKGHSVFNSELLLMFFHSCTSVFVLKIKNVIIHMYNSNIQL